MKYAAYDDFSIYAIAPSPIEAFEKARVDAMEPNAHFLVAKVTEDFAAWIEENGWHGNSRSFELRDGFLVDTTEE